MSAAEFEAMFCAVMEALDDVPLKARKAAALAMRRAQFKAKAKDAAE